jgi:hypothetical protein
MKKYLPLLLFLFIVSCGTGRPLSTSPSDNNQTYKVDFLFEHNGCKVYRFYDEGHYVYFTNCNGETIAKTDSTEVRNRILVQGQ